VTPSNDLPGRIRRLERLLDAMEQTRRTASGDVAPIPQTPTAIDRLREITAILQERLATPEIDEGDAIAMRALLEEFAGMTTELRGQASALAQRLEVLGDSVKDGSARLAALEEAG
jgi:hypothetical protein